MSRRSGSSHGLGMYWLRPARLIASTTASRPACPVSRIFVVRGTAPVDLLEQLDALHAGHDLVGDHDRDRLAVPLQLVDQLERLARVLARPRCRTRRRSAPPSCWRSAARMPSSSSTQTMCSRMAVMPAGSRAVLCRGALGRFGHRPGRRDRGLHRRSGAGGGPSTGRRTSKRVQPGSLSTRIVPPCFSTIRAQMLRAEPGALALGLGREERLEDPGSDVSRDPGPVLDRRLITSLPSDLVSIKISPRPSSACTALWIRFVHTWFSSPTYAVIGGSVPYDRFTLTPFSPYFN